MIPDYLVKLQANLNRLEESNRKIKESLAALDSYSAIMNGIDLMFRVKNWEVISNRLDLSDVEDFVPSEDLKNL